MILFPVDTGLKLSVHNKTFKRRPGRLLNVFMFNLCPVSRVLLLRLLQSLNLMLGVTDWIVIGMLFLVSFHTNVSPKNNFFGFFLECASNNISHGNAHMFISCSQLLKVLADVFRFAKVESANVSLANTLALILTFLSKSIK